MPWPYRILSCSSCLSDDNWIAAQESVAAQTPHMNDGDGINNPDRVAFISRQREMDQLKVALGAALSGRGRLVMLAGEPGIGKTRTSEELASHAISLTASGSL